MPTPLDLDAVSLEDLKKLVVQLMVEVTRLREVNQQLRAENARLKDLPKKPAIKEPPELSRPTPCRRS